MGEIESQIHGRIACEFRFAVPTLSKLNAHGCCSQIHGTDRAQRGMGSGEQAEISVKFKSRRTSLLVLRQKSSARSDIGVMLEGGNPPNMDFVRAERQIGAGPMPNSSRGIRILFLDFRAQSSRIVVKLSVEGYSFASNHPTLRRDALPVTITRSPSRTICRPHGLSKKIVVRGCS